MCPYRWGRTEEMSSLRWRLDRRSQSHRGDNQPERGRQRSTVSTWRPAWHRRSCPRHLEYQHFSWQGPIDMRSASLDVKILSVALGSLKFTDNSASVK